MAEAAPARTATPTRDGSGLARTGTPQRKGTGDSAKDAGTIAGEVYAQTRQSKSSIKIASIKLAIIGNAGVGKTALKERFDEDTFGIDYRATVGMDLKTKLVSIPIDAKGDACTDEQERVSTKQAKVMLFDTAGQEKYSSIQRQTLRGSLGVIIVFDVADPPMGLLERPGSFADVKAKWLPLVRELNDELTDPRLHPLVLLIGNKTDLPQRTTTSSQAKSYAEQEGLFYYETSAKTGDNVAKAFNAFVAAVCRDKHVFKPELAPKPRDDTVHLGSVPVTIPGEQQTLSDETRSKDDGCAC